VTIQVIPESVNFFYHPLAPGRRLQLDADDQGVVRFHARAFKSAEPTEFHLECHGADGEIELYTVLLSADVHYSPWMSGNDLEPQPAVLGEVRPPLAGDPMVPSNIELTRNGYPPRPDPAKSPADYARWLKNVSRSYTRINPRQVAHPEYGEVKRGPVDESYASQQRSGPSLVRPQAVEPGTDNSANSRWCGAYYRHPTNEFDYIHADWVVPVVFDLPKGPRLSAVVQWIGLDNAGQDLYQAGTGSECLTFQGFQITTYYLWMESVPWSWWEIPNFPVAPNDEISVDIWVANQYSATLDQDGNPGGLAPEDDSVWFYVNNATNGASFMGTYPVASEPLYGVEEGDFEGHTAGFVLERPTINGHLAPLARFTPTAMTHCSYGDSQAGEYNMFPLGADKGMPPFDGRLTYLNMVDRATNRLLAEPLVIPDPSSSPDAHAILFAWQNYQ
jgi:hypothetical protein